MKQICFVIAALAIICIGLTACSTRVRLQGKFVSADGSNQFLVGKKACLKQEKRNRIISSSIINEFGEFKFKKVNPNKTYLVELDKKAIGFPGGIIYLTDAAGKVVREIRCEPNIFSFNFLPSDITWLAEKKEEDVTVLFREFMRDTAKTETLLIRNIYYETGAYLLSVRNKKSLNKIIKILKENKNIKLDIASFTDATGDDAYNLDLSEKRAGQIENYFLSKGINKERLKVGGYGETKILNRCVNGVKCSDIENSVNRRTEFLFQKQVNSR